MIRRILLFFSVALGLLIIITTLVSVRLTEGMDLEGIEVIIDYAKEYKGNPLAEKDSYLIYYMNKINQYSYSIITGSIILIVSASYLLRNKRRD